MSEVMQFFRTHPTLWEWLKLIVMAVGTFIVLWFVLRLERRLARKWLNNKENINTRLVERLLRFALIIVAVQWVMFSSKITQPFAKALFQGTTVLAAIAGFAAQPVIADLICGVMLSSTKPFDMGDRIELEDGTSGIVKDITLRHVVLQGVDTIDLIIPNSKLNAMKLRNMSRVRGFRSIHFRFKVAYPTDIERARAIIQKAVEESPYAVPAKPGPDGPVYGPVYFMEYGDSALELNTTVYYTASNTTERVRSDINARVKQAIEAAGIEIPYEYVNVVVRDENGKV